MFSRMVCMMLYKFPLHIYIYTYLIAILVHVFVDWNDATGTPVVATQVS